MLVFLRPHQGLHDIQYEFHFPSAGTSSPSNSRKNARWRHAARGRLAGPRCLVGVAGTRLPRQWRLWLAIVVCVLNILGAAPGLVEAPNAALQVTAAATAVGFALIIVLVVLQSHSVPLQQLSPTFSGPFVLGLVRWSPILPAATLIRTGQRTFPKDCVVLGARLRPGTAHRAGECQRRAVAWLVARIPPPELSDEPLLAQPPLDGVLPREMAISPSAMR
jgi:hypothetical protein